eukprot:gene5438-biopygen16239
MRGRALGCVFHEIDEMGGGTPWRLMRAGNLIGWGGAPRGAPPHHLHVGADESRAWSGLSTCFNEYLGDCDEYLGDCDEYLGDCDEYLGDCDEYLGDCDVRGNVWPFNECLGRARMAARKNLPLVRIVSPDLHAQHGHSTQCAFVGGAATVQVARRRIQRATWSTSQGALLPFFPARRHARALARCGGMRVRMLPAHEGACTGTPVRGPKNPVEGGARSARAEGGGGGRRAGRDGRDAARSPAPPPMQKIHRAHAYAVNSVRICPEHAFWCALEMFAAAVCRRGERTSAHSVWNRCCSCGGAATPRPKGRPVVAPPSDPRSFQRRPQKNSNEHGRISQ